MSRLVRVDSPSALPLDLRTVRRVLAVKLSSFGDIVHATPCLRALRHACPDAEILVAVDRTFAPILCGDPHLDGLIEADPAKRGLFSSYLGARRQVGERAGARFDLAIDFQGRTRSAVWIYASRARYCVGRGGFRPGWEGALQPDADQHAVDVCAAIAARAGIAVADLQPRLFPSAAVDRDLDALLDSIGVPRSGFVVANPFGSWRAKRWPVERWAALIDRLHHVIGVAVVVSGSAGETAEARRLSLLARPSPASLVGRTTLEQAICLFRRAALVVSGDSGPLHAAAAVGTPVVGLFGPTWPERNGPRGSEHRVIQASRPRSPRYYRQASAQRHMEAIEVQPVLDAIVGLLRGRAK